MAFHIKEWSPNFKDGELLNAVIAALQDRELWVFVKVFYIIIFGPLEKVRRWGIGCSCCSELRHSTNKRSKCPRASRRLREARLFTGQLIFKFNAADNRVDWLIAESVEWIATRASFVARKTGLDIIFKTSYLNNSLRRIAETDDPAQARILHEQFGLGACRVFPFGARLSQSSPPIAEGTVL